MPEEGGREEDGGATAAPEAVVGSGFAGCCGRAVTIAEAMKEYATALGMGPKTTMTQ